MALLQKAVKGIFWTYFTYIWQRLLNLIVTAILARILVPEEFGLIAFAMLLITFIDSVRGFGINDALIYTSTDIEKSTETAFVINSILGILQYLVAFLVAPLAVNFFDDPRLVSVLRALSLTFIFDGLGKTHDALLQKELLFRKSALPEITANAIKGIVSVVLALMGFDVWSIVIGQVVGSAAKSTAKWIAVGWIPKLKFFPDAARGLWQYGVHILIFTVLNVALEQADQLFIGTMLGSLQLGFYTIGVRIPELVIANFSLFISKSFFPYLTKFQDNRHKIIEGFTTTTKYTALITIPAGIGMVAIAKELILVLYGDQWEPAVIILQILALLGVMATLQWSIGDVLKAIGKPEIPTRLLFLEALYTFPLIFIFVLVNRSAMMASLANLIAVTISAIIRMFVISKILGIKFLGIIKLFLTPFISASFMYASVYGWKLAGYKLDLPIIIILIISILIGAIVYGGFIWLFEKDALLSAWKLVKETTRKNKPDTEPAS